MNLGIVTGEFNPEITSAMEKRALDKAKSLNVNVVTILKVPGSYDMPLIVKKLLQRKDIDAVVTLGAIIKGDTKHDETIGYVTANRLADLSVEFEKPVALGIIGPGATWEQAEKRAEEYAERALIAAIKLHEEMKKI